MRVGVVGLGVVGSAQAYLMNKLGYEIIGYDITNRELDYVEPTSDLSAMRSCDVVFVCTPDDAVPEVVDGLVAHGVDFIVIKSTVPPKTTVNLMRKYGVHICHNPEFLRERYAYHDILNQSRIVIGKCCDEHARLLVELYRPLNTPIYVVDPTTSEIIKIVTNCLRATMISFWNEVHELCRVLNVDTKTVAEVVNPAKAIGEWEGGDWGTRFFGKPFGGKCLPKDLQHLILALESNNIPAYVLRGVHNRNENLEELLVKSGRL